MILTREQALEIFKRRVSVRYYDPAHKISAEDFAAILDFGRLSPSSVGCEPWQFVVVQNAALREKIKPFALGDAGFHFGCQPRCFPVGTKTRPLRQSRF